MCKVNKYLIEVFENFKYKYTINAVFETKELAEMYINLYMKGRSNITCVTRLVEYYY